MNNNFVEWFLHSNENNVVMYEKLMEEVQSLVKDQLLLNDRPFSGASREEIKSVVQEVARIPVNAQKIERVMEEIQEGIMRHSLWISHPAAIAHLHCPPLLPSLAAEVLISVLNQSMGSWDQSPSATYVEAELIKFFTKVIGYEQNADGVFTSGGTQSNYMGMLLARNLACQNLFQVNVQAEGLPAEAKKLRILCSEHADFTVQQSAAQLGLGTDAVVKVATNDLQQLCAEEVRKKIIQLRKDGFLPFMVAATAGTTDFGSIDHIQDIAELAKEENLWLHVDAAYGGALLFSHQYRHLVEGLSLADSISIDFHKLYYQSISCGAFFVKNKQSFAQIAHHAAYLNPEEDLEKGILNLVEKSVQTTRRFDALKLLMTFKLMGTNSFGEMVDYTIDLAKKTAELLKAESEIEVLNVPEINAIVFRYLPSFHSDKQFVNAVNAKLQHHFYQSGTLIMAKTKHNGNVYLKFTMLNPLNDLNQMKGHIHNIKQAGKIIEQERGVKV